MQLTDHYAVRRGWNAARSKKFSVESPAYTVTAGVQLKRMVPTVGPQSPMPSALSSPICLAHPPTPGAVPPRHRGAHRPPWPAREEAAFAASIHSWRRSTAGRSEIAAMCRTGQTAREPTPRARPPEKTCPFSSAPFSDLNVFTPCFSFGCCNLRCMTHLGNICQTKGTGK